jgi:hypothetical protein
MRRWRGDDYTYSALGKGSIMSDVSTLTREQLRDELERLNESRTNDARRREIVEELTRRMLQS